MERLSPTERSTSDDVLNVGDWRGPTDTPPSPPPKPPTAPQPPRSLRALHVHARPASVEKERERARDVVHAARDTLAETFSEIRFGRKIRSANLAPIVSAIVESVNRNPGALASVARLKSHHEYTYLHSVAVCGLMVALGNELQLGPELRQDIGLAGLLHDIGKARIDVDLLERRGPLNPDEVAIVQKHTLHGYELLRRSGLESEIALDVCLHHHERVDGSGYPSGISAQTLSTYSRMAAVCDVFDAMTSERPYKASCSPGAALEGMMATRGQFDPRILRAFRSLLGAFPVGSLVRLESQRLAIVVDDPADNPTHPDVCVFLCAQSRRELPPSRINTRSDPIIGIETAAQWRLDDFENRRAQMLAEHGAA